VPIKNKVGPDLSSKNLLDNTADVDDEENPDSEEDDEQAELKSQREKKIQILLQKDQRLRNCRNKSNRLAQKLCCFRDE
jgi:hypothetical protein